MTPRLRAQLGEREEDVQRAIITALRYKGYRVLQTSVRLRRCPACGAPPAGKYGADLGVPDLLVWVAGAFRGIEVKGPTTRVSPEQAELAALGMIVICRSIDDALDAVNKWEEPK